MYEVTMPRLSDSMEEGKIIQWKVREGDAVHEGGVLAEIESDKAVMELECFHDGRVVSIVHGDGDEVRVGEIIAYLASPTEKVDVPAKPAAKPAAAAVLPAVAALVAAPPPKPAAAEVKPAAPVAKPPAKRIAISPYARKLAESRGIDTTQLAGTGENGRIMARDVERAAAAGTGLIEKPMPAKEPARSAADEELPPLEVTEDEADVEPASFRLKTQVRRVVAAKHVIPHFYVTTSVDVTALLARRAELKEQMGATVTHLVLAACLKAVERHPEVNRSYDRGNIIRWKGVNLGLAVQAGEGLTVAVLRNAQTLPLAEIVRQTADLAERARTGKLTADERRHATFTVSNLGMFDVEHFAAILNPPSSITLAVASALDAPVIRGGGIYVGKVMKMTASCDHRIVDGVMAARFLKTLKGLLEEPDAFLEAGT